MMKKWERTGKAEGELGDDGSGDGESDEERPVAVEFPLEENGPRIEFPHSVCVIAMRLFPMIEPFLRCEVVRM